MNIRLGIAKNQPSDFAKYQFGETTLLYGNRMFTFFRWHAILFLSVYTFAIIRKDDENEESN